MFIVEYRLAGDATWAKWGSGNTRRTAEVSEANCWAYLDDMEAENAEVRIRKER